jgi:hypothetical protein
LHVCLTATGRKGSSKWGVNDCGIYIQSHRTRSWWLPVILSINPYIKHVFFNSLLFVEKLQT